MLNLSVPLVDGGDYLLIVRHGDVMEYESNSKELVGEMTASWTPPQLDGDFLLIIRRGGVMVKKIQKEIAGGLKEGVLDSPTGGLWFRVDIKTGR